MTFAAVFEGEIAAKRLSAVVTAQTRHAARGHKMLGGCRGTDLACLRGAGGEPVTVGTREPFS